MLADAVYIHIPFCKKICHYCAFNKYFYDGQPVDKYLVGLDTEMALYEIPSTTVMDTIYVGGGTPSCLNREELTQLLQSIERRLAYNEQTEYTFEVNPGELTPEKSDYCVITGSTVSVWGFRPSMINYCVRLGAIIANTIFTSVSTGCAMPVSRI